MGQDLTHPSLQLQRTNPSKHSHSLSGSKMKSIYENKTLIILVDGQEFLVQVNDSTLTCGWLVSETIRLCGENKNIIGLKSFRNFEAVDYWLMHFERSLQPFRNNEKFLPVFREPVSNSIGPDHFAPVKFIGKGGFSYVIEVRKKDTGMLYAAKTMKKESLIKEEKLSQVLSEKKILSSISYPFVVHLHWAFQTVRNN